MFGRKTQDTWTTPAGAEPRMVQYSHYRAFTVEQVREFDRLLPADMDPSVTGWPDAPTGTPCAVPDCPDPAVKIRLCETLETGANALPLCDLHGAGSPSVVVVAPKVRVLVNLTPHPFTIIRDGEPVAVIRPELTSARCAEEQTLEDQVLVPGTDGLVSVPVYRTGYGTVSGLPEPRPGTLYLVSQLVAAALPLRDDLVWPARVVRDGSGQIIGAEGITK